MTGRPLRPANHHSLGGPLPHQLANGTRAHPGAVACKQRPPLIRKTEVSRTPSGISTPFEVLFPTPGQVTHALLTRAPLYSSSCPEFLVRLACVRHAASVRSEPGSNSPIFIVCTESRRTLTFIIGKNDPTTRFLLFSFQRADLLPRSLL